MYSIKSDLKKNLKQNYATILIQCFSSLILASVLIVAIPLSFRTNSNKDKIINSLSFVTCSICCLIAYIKSNYLIEIGGKITMLTQLEKESFIKENLITQERYLTAVSDSLIPVNIEPEFYHDQSPTPPHHTTPHTTQDAITIDTQDNHTTTPHTDQPLDVLICPNCGSNNLSNHGLTSTKKQRFKCNDCNKTFS